MRDKDPAAARQAVTQTLTGPALDGSTLGTACSLLFYIGEFPAAASTCEKAIAQGHGDPQIWQLLAQAYAKLGRPEQQRSAERRHQQALGQQP